LRNEIAGIDGRMNSLVEVSYLFNHGELAYRAGEYLKAVDFLGRAVVLDPRNPRILYRLGRALTNAGDHVAAPDRFKEMKALGGSSGEPERGLSSHRFICRCCGLARVPASALGATVVRLFTGCALRSCEAPSNPSGLT
jgi:tetratricopeptide (TPR) repeat protein